jgi:hypothetical protein
MNHKPNEDPLASHPSKEDFPVEVAREMLKANKETKIIDPITDGRMAERMSELREMGLEDIPSAVGLRSSMRVYAEATFAFTTEKPDEEMTTPPAFVTLDKALLSRADELEKRYSVRPMLPDEAMTKAKSTGEKIKFRVTRATLNDCTKSIFEMQLKEHGMRPQQLTAEQIKQGEELVEKALLEMWNQKGMEVDNSG